MGHVILECDDLRLTSRRLSILFTGDQDFGGARAEGEITLVDGNTVMFCDSMTLGQDRVQGKVTNALVRIKKDSVAKIGPDGIPVGPDEAVFHGDIERTGKDTLRIEDAEYTLCDCGEDPPSWVLRARRIDATLGKRAWIYGPVLAINPFGLALLPITPPLLPLSVPLTHRAAGFLPPRYTFLDPPWPMVDVPFFIPLGDSWDVTLTPGIRFDWGEHDPNPKTWGVPRLGGRIRYAPFEGLDGVFETQWTYDRRKRAAEIFANGQYRAIAKANSLETNIVRELCEGARPPANGVEADIVNDHCTAIIEERDRRADLVHRVTTHWWQRWHVNEELHWAIDFDWVSDDRILGDFGVGVRDRVRDYTPSRTQLAWRSPGLWASLSSDYYLLFGNNREGAPPHDKNIGGFEAQTIQRSPALELNMLPVPIMGPFAIDAVGSFVRYGPWHVGSGTPQWIAGGHVGLSAAQTLGPVHTRSRAQISALRVDEAEQTNVLSTLTVDARAELPLARRFRRVVHHLVPALRYRGLPLLEATDANGGIRDGAFDERLQVRKFHQLMLQVDQSLVTFGKGDPVVQLTLAQPWDLEKNEILPFRAALQLNTFIRLRALVDVNFLLKREPMQAVSADMGIPLGPIYLNVDYSRWAPTAERFRRTLYELSAPSTIAGGEIAGSEWVHSIGAGASLDTRVLDLSYGVTALLPLPEDPGVVESDRPYITEHIFRMNYRSPCNCWGLGAVLSVPAQNPEAFRLSFTLDIGGVGVGAGI